ncbi:MAG: bifunctional nuclease family protein [Coriobacteriales bacterium]|jgi:bifunctional DNase/RNase|nr:bifunctional nuclease family protein [Coriobacteriales bacterium]
MIEVAIFTVVVASPSGPSVVVLAEKGALSGALSGVDTSAEAGADTTDIVTDLVAPQLLPIWIGHSEAQAIMLLLDSQPHPRPLTHDLLATVIGELGSTVDHIVIDKLAGSTFFATVCLVKDGEKIFLDARPSDSIALALRSGAHIFIDEDVMNAAGRQFSIKVSDGGELLYGSDTEMERFHAFIESVSPEDFSV